MQDNKSENTIKILFVDDSLVFRHAIKLLIEQEENLKVIDIVDTEDKLFDALKEKELSLVILNVNIPKESANAICRRMNEKYPHIPILVLSGGELDYTITKCIDRGVQGVILKDCSPEEFILAINKVACGEKYIRITKTNLIANHRKDSENQAGFISISERERSVLKLFSEGYTYKEIGDDLNISPRTVESHKKNLLTKFGLNSLSELISYAIKHKLI